MEKIQTRFRRAALVACALTILAVAAPAHAVVDLRGGVYTDLEKPFAGAGLFFHGSGPLYLNPNVEYVFVDDGTFGTANFDLLLQIPTGGSPRIWGGGGLALVYTDPEIGASDTKPRANIIGGIGFGGRTSPYLQAKYITGIGEWVLSAGIRF
jgi:hypothetical protein